MTGSAYVAHCAYLHPPCDPGFDIIRQRAADLDAPLHGIADRGACDVSVVRQLLKLCRQLNVQIWHAHDYKTNLLGLLLRPFHRMHLVTTVHGWALNDRKSQFYYWIDRRCLPRYGRVICVSSDLASECRRYGVADDRCVLLENGIDLSHYTRTLCTAAAKRQLGFDPSVPLIGAVGRLSEEKGFDVLIDAVARLHWSGHKVALAIAGEGKSREALERRIQAQPHPERFHLLGFQHELRPFYQALDVFALSSRREGLPNVLLEALALEAPVVATAIAGVPRVIEHQHNGLLVPTDNVGALAEALSQLLSDRPLATRLAEEGRNTVASRFSFAARMQQEIAIYDQLLQKPPR